MAVERAFCRHSLQWLAAGWVLAILWARNLSASTDALPNPTSFVDCAVAPLGCAVIVLLYRSWFQHKILKRVSWKGRSYKT